MWRFLTQSDMLEKQGWKQISGKDREEDGENKKGVGGLLSREWNTDGKGRGSDAPGLPGAGFVIFITVKIVYMNCIRFTIVYIQQPQHPKIKNIPTTSVSFQVDSMSRNELS